MQRIKEKLLMFMSGRYGSDAMSKTLLWVGIGLSVINLFMRSVILYALVNVILVYVIFRFMSRKYYNRRAENEKFLAFVRKMKQFFCLQRDKFRDLKTHVYKKCPHCKATVRLPRVSGEHGVTCPHCSKHFDVKI